METYKAELENKKRKLKKYTNGDNNGMVRDEISECFPIPSPSLPLKIINFIPVLSPLKERRSQSREFLVGEIPSIHPTHSNSVT